MNRHPFYNISNHPSRNPDGTHAWSRKQFEAAWTLGNGEIIDIKGPMVDPHADTEAVIEQARELVAKIPSGATVHAMSDFTLTCALVNVLRAKGCNPVFATTARHAVEVANPDGTVTKTATFEFVRFRAAP
jgi:hypothetical protein